jgi:hypothetical protein
MLNFLKSLFTSNSSAIASPTSNKFTPEEYDAHYEQKKQALETLLGEMYHLVGHAIIPFQVGGPVDMYYFLNSDYAGTAFATMELIEPDGSGPKPNAQGKTYELVAFTKQQYSGDKDSEFEQIEMRIRSTFTTIANYAYQTAVKPLDTAEVPDDEGTKYLIFAEYTKPDVLFEINQQQHTLLLCIEVFKPELDFARAQGTANLISKLKDQGYYPYSDLDRQPVV